MNPTEYLSQRANISRAINRAERKARVVRWVERTFFVVALVFALSSVTLPAGLSETEGQGPGHMTFNPAATIEPGIVLDLTR